MIEHEALLLNHPESKMCNDAWCLLSSDTAQPAGNWKSNMASKYVPVRPTSLKLNWFPIYDIENYIKTVLKSFVSWCVICPLQLLRFPIRNGTIWKRICLVPLATEEFTAWRTSFTSYSHSPKLTTKLSRHFSSEYSGSWWKPSLFPQVCPLTKWCFYWK